jgi:quinol monooxygenase YgiN
MRHVMASYRLRRETLEESKAVIQEYLEQVQKAEAGTLSYQCFQSESDPTRFIHLMSFAHEEAEATHAVSPFLKQFSERLFPHCTDGPHYETLQLIARRASDCP